MRHTITAAILAGALSACAPAPLMPPAVVDHEAIAAMAEEGCTTDSECAELCPVGTRDLPADHPDFCDGGPQS